MTALNVFVQPDAVHVLTDGAAVLDTEPGRIAHLCHKIMPLPYHRAVLAFRGRAGATHSLAGDLDVAASFADLRRSLSERARANHEAVARQIGPFEIEVVVAGWPDDAEEPEAWLLSSLDRPGLPAWTPAEVSVLASPLVDIPLTYDMDPVVDGLRIMRRQRDGFRMPGDTPSLVGGFAQITSVNRDRIETRILERWT